MTSDKGAPSQILTFDVEDWFHILDSPASPPISQWNHLEPRLEANLNRILDLLAAHGIHATFFWLGWAAERYPGLVRRCQREGHEIASHGYGHLLAYQAGAGAFGEDILRARYILEDLAGEKIAGFRAPGFGITDDSPWAFSCIRRAGHEYDSSVFPMSRGHGGMAQAPLGPYRIATQDGDLIEMPMSAISVLGRRCNMFGGGYLRLFPLWAIRWGIRRLRAEGHPLVVYLHPREVDPGHPRLPLSRYRSFKSYVNLKSTWPKLQWLCAHGAWQTMKQAVADLA